jgi:acyl-CoA synthetase (AMP-forming)/AMP-acid ligase II
VKRIVIAMGMRLGGVRLNGSTLSVFGDIARANALAFGGKTAFIEGGRAFTFGQVNERMNRLSNALARLGVAKGDRVAILSRNRAEYVEAYGVAKSGLVAVPLNWRLTARELLHPLHDSRPVALLAEPEFTEAIDRVRGEIPGTRHFVCFGPPRDGWTSYEALLSGASAEEPRAHVEPGDVLCLMYTSGTTGVPKGAVLTHGSGLRNCDAAVQCLSLEPGDVALAVMPLFHVGGMWYHLFPSYARGCTTVLLSQFDARETLAALAVHRVSNVHLVPTMMHALLARPEIADSDLSRLRLLYYAASSIPAELLRRAMHAFRHSGLLQSYGSTEAGIVTALRPEEHRAALDDPASEQILCSCGRAVEGGEVRIADARGGEARCGAPGEIVVRSDRLMAGYWENPGATRQAMSGGWLGTGDIGRIDGNGRLYILDRKHDMIVTGGENVYPREIENILAQDPDVLEVAVFGLPDPEWVEKVAAAIVLKPGSSASAEDIVGRARLRLAAYKCPKTVLFERSLPRSATGKVLKRELRQRYA